jgi:hypothetical protein
MERQYLYNDIEARLSWLVSRIELRGSFNILDLNVHSEDFFAQFLNLLFNWQLRNANVQEQNVAGIDLVDDNSKIVLQVSSDATKRKVEMSLCKNLSLYSKYNFKFLAIVNDASKLKKMNFHNPHRLIFIPNDDIYDIKTILNYIKGRTINEIEEIAGFLQDEIKIEPSAEKIESNFTTIIEIIAKEKWADYYPAETVPFNIEQKIAYNNLVASRSLITDYMQYYTRIDRIYEEFDKQGNNKSISVLNNFRSLYISYIAKGNVNPSNADVLFQKIINDVIITIKNSLNYNPIIEEELKMCVEILTVDAFIRCKIFKNPEVK